MDHETEPMTPIPVTGEVTLKHGTMLVHEEAADFGAYDTIVFTGTESPRRLLPYDENRARAYITCTGTGPVYVGSAAQTQASPTLGFLLATGITLPVMHKQAVWIVPDGTHSATVSVAIERWES